MHAIFAIISAAFLTLAVVRTCQRILPPGPPCPKISLKDIIAVVFAIIGAIIYFYIAKTGFGTITEPLHFVNAHIAAVALGAGIRAIICPY